MKKTSIIILFLIISSFLIAAYAYQNIQSETIASHWDINGKVNGYMPKLFGLSIFPIILVGMYLMFLFIPKIDPLKKIESFRKYYDYMILAIILFLFYVFILTILFNMDYSFNMTIMIMPAVGLLFILLGILMRKLKRNWFVGIRTPWTISSDVVWEKTHKLGSILFIAIGLIIAASVFFQASTGFILAPIIISTIVLIVYSYLEFKKLKN